MCPLCFCEQIFPLAPIDSKIYHRCKVCGLTFLSPEFHLNAEAQRSRYETHQNSPLDSRYRVFLSRMTDFLIPKLLPGWTGLDFGSGPGPTLSVMLEEKGFQMKIYDPYFAPQTDVRSYRSKILTSDSKYLTYFEMQRYTLPRFPGIHSLFNFLVWGAK